MSRAVREGDRFAAGAQGERAFEGTIDRVACIGEGRGGEGRGVGARRLCREQVMTGTTGSVGAWRLVRRIGEGAMGEVWEGASPTGMRVAIKRIRGSLLADDRVRRHFIREARAAARLCHPHIVDMLDFVTVDGASALVMEYVDGEPLSSWREAPPSGMQLLEVVDQVLSALAHAHARGIIHRDLKPENILLTREEGRLSARLMDLGVAHFRDDASRDRWSEDTLVGTPAYMGPEQALKASDVTPETDLYAVGVMLFELVTGRLPFEGRSAMGTMMAHLRDPVPPLALRSEYVSQKGLDVVVRRLLAKVPSSRWRFAVQVREALSRCTLQRAGDPPSRPRVLRLRERVEPPAAREQAERLGTPCTGLTVVRDAPFCGRDGELAVLLEAASAAVQGGHTRVVLVEGSMGMGRSRLVTHLREVLEEEGRMGVWRGDARGGQGDEAAIRSAVAEGLHCAGFSGPEAEQRVSRLLERQGVSAPAEHAALVAFLEDAGEAEVVGGEEARLALVDRVTRRASQEHPLCLVLEDVHLTNGAPLRLAERLLLERAGSGPRLVVLTLRPEEVPARGDTRAALDRLLASGSGRVARVELARLREPSMRRLVRAMVALPDPVADAVALRAEGNPLVAVELVRHLADSGRLERPGAVPDASELLVDWPDGIQALMRQRIDAAAHQHGERALGVWMRLAWLGSRFDVALALERLLLEGPALARELEAALAAATVSGLLVEERRDVFRFEHALVRDALRDRVEGADEVREQALRAAQARERAHAGADGPHLLLVARDYLVAEARDQAADAFLRAARSARRTGRYSDACEAWQELAAMLEGPAARGDMERGVMLVQALLGLAEDSLLLGRFEDAAEALERVDATCAPAGVATPAKAQRLRAELEQRRGSTRTARALYEDAIERFAAHGDMRGGAQARFRLGLLELHDGRLSEAEAHMRQARQEFELVGDVAMETECFSTLGRTALAAGLHDEAAGLIEKARYRHERAGYRLGLAHATLNLAEVELARGDVPSTRRHAEAAWALFGDVGAEHPRAHATLVLGRAAAQAGQTALAADHYAQAAEAFSLLGDPQALAIVRLCQALLDTEAHQWESAVAHTEDALARDAEERIDDTLFVDLLLDTGRAVLLGGLGDLALRLLETAAFKLRRLGEESVHSDRLDEVQYLLLELRDGGLSHTTGPLPAVPPGRGERLDDL
ncbi:MAG: hypothetical protein EA398_14425 [Deltaproteobacteria bacterium]|nr:MAG: hypothetical protein EA398_14425 [Deltaproteobacteria bacterium]